MSLIDKAASGVKWNSAATLIKVATQFFTLIILARLLDPTDFGLMSMVLIVTNFTQAFIDFGLGNALIHRQNATRQQLSSLYWFNLAIGFTLFGILWLSVPLIVAYYQEPTLEPVFRWVILIFLLVPFGQQFQSLLKKELRFKTLSLIEVADHLVYGLTAVILAWWGFGVMSLVGAVLARTAVATGALVTVAIRSRWLPLLHFHRADLRGFLGFGLFQMGERSLNYLATNVDYLIIGRFLGSEALGYYTIAYNLIRLPHAYINPAIVSVAFPSFARVQSQNDRLRWGYAKILRYLSTITFPVMGGIFIIAPFLIPLLYGEQWLPSVTVVQIFCLVGVWKSLGNPIGSLLLAKGRADLGFYMNLIAVIGYTISNIIGVRWGINGVAISTLLFQTAILVPFGFYLRWLTVQMRAVEYWEAIKRAGLATAVMLIFLIPLYYALTPLNTPFIQMIGLVISGILVYAITIIKLDYPTIQEAWLRLTPQKLFTKKD